MNLTSLGCRYEDRALCDIVLSRAAPLVCVVGYRDLLPATSFLISRVAGGLQSTTVVMLDSLHVLGVAA